MNDKNNPLDSLPQNEWDAFIKSITYPFTYYARRDPLISSKDLEQEAWVALLSAAKNYDASKAKFTTYAYYYIRGRILRYILEKTRTTCRRIDADPTDVESGYVDNTLQDKEMFGSILSSISNEQYANFIVEHYINGKSFRKIAKENGLSHQGVAMHIKRLINLIEKRISHENS